MHRKNQNMEKAKLASLSKAFKYMEKYNGLVIIALVMAALSAVLALIAPNRIGDLTDVMKDGLMGDMDMSAIASIGITLIIIYGLTALFAFLQHYIMATVTLNTSRRMRNDLSAKINKVPMGYFNTTSQGDVLSRITNDVMTLQQGLTNSLPTMISSIAQFVGCLIMMFYTQWILAFCVIGVSMLGMVALMIIMKKSQKYFFARQMSLGALNGYIEEMYSGHQVVRISRADKKIKASFEKLNDSVYDADWKSHFISGIMMPVMNIVGNLSYVVVCVVGAALAINGTISFGVIISFVIYCRLFSNPLQQMAQALTNLQMAAAGSNRIFDFLDAEEMPDESEKTASIENIKGGVEFKNVKFGYPGGEERIIIKNFSAKVTPGQKVAIVGPTGAGKTTMVNLLMRFFDINDGNIFIDGVSINDIKREDIHDLFGMVLQDTWLFEGTIRENLIYNMENVSDEELERVCKACGISHFVHTLPQGFDTVLSETTSISAGQKQLLTIARAMLQNSPMLILDEATSSVDTRTEVLIQKAMDELTKGRTSFVIAHRLSTIKNADLILVMKDGDVIESGNHDELMAQGGFYEELYNSQFATAE